MGLFEIVLTIVGTIFIPGAGLIANHFRLKFEDQDNELARMEKKMDVLDASFNEYRLRVSREYVSKEDFRELVKEIKVQLTRIEDKIDRKADK